MAGSEKSGFVNAKAHLIENAYYILTPSAKVPREKIDAYRSFVESLKALPILLDYRQHDYITGTISHLPHIIASCLVNFVRETDNEEELMKMLAAGGLKDITRIASSSPVMWQQICLKNKENLNNILDHYIDTLRQAKTFIQSGAEKELYSMFASSKVTGTLCPTLRQALSNGNLPCTAISSTKPGESPPSPRFWRATISASKISESYTTGSLKRVFSA